MDDQGVEKMSSLCISTTEMHTAGDPVRIIESGFPQIIGTTMAEKVTYVKTHLQYLRKFLTNEPRGHRDMVGFILVEPDKDSGASVGVIYFDSSVFLDMCGHMTIALCRYAIDKGLVPAVSPRTTFKIQAPCGVIEASTVVSPDGKTGASSFISVPAFVWKTGVDVEVPTLGKITVDISFGGAFYAILPASHIGLDVNTTTMEDLTRTATAISDALRASIRLQHPLNKDITYLQGTILTDGNDEFSTQPTAHTVALCEYAQVPRAPCGSGTTARVALQYHMQKVKLNETRIFENAITKTRFNATPRTETKCGDFPAVHVEIEGRAFYTGSATFTFETGDRLGAGFIPGVKI